jgi:hypothetical protein
MPCGASLMFNWRVLAVHVQAHAFVSRLAAGLRIARMACFYHLYVSFCAYGFDWAVSLNRYWDGRVARAGRAWVRCC